MSGAMNDLPCPPKCILREDSEKPHSQVVTIPPRTGVEEFLVGAWVVVVTFGGVPQITPHIWPHAGDDEEQRLWRWVHSQVGLMVLGLELRTGCPHHELQPRGDLCGAAAMDSEESP